MDVTFSEDNGFAVDSGGLSEVEDGDADGGAVYEDLGGEDPSSDYPETKKGDSADEIDPFKLTTTPNVNELRKYYNRTFAKILVDKPVDDAFKNGFEVTGVEDAASFRDVLSEFDAYDFEETYIEGRKKSRRDGFCLLYIGWKSASKNLSASAPPTEVTGIDHLKLLRLEDVSHCAKERIADEVPLDVEDFEVRESGIVVDRRIESPNFNDPVGYALNSDEPKFIHKDWILHLVNNPEVDGAIQNDTYNNLYDDEDNLGKWEGESELTACYDLLKTIKKSNWSIGQALYRYAAMMYVLKVPESANEQEIEDAIDQFRNLNAKSEFVFPSEDYEVEDFGTEGQLEPREYYDVIFDQICACTEMTKSVLFGTQTGTVTGSETDIKNYYNQVSRNQNNMYARDIMTFWQMCASVDTADGVELLPTDVVDDVRVEWKPLFKVSQEDRVEMIRTTANMVTMLINNYALTPDEARGILSEEWAEFDLDDLTEEQYDIFDRLNLTQVGAYRGANIAESELEGNPRRQNGGGRQEGQTLERNDPTSEGGR